MTVKELIAELMDMPQDANVEACFRHRPDFAEDVEVISVTKLLNSDEWVTLGLGGMVCDHA